MKCLNAWFVPSTTYFKLPRNHMQIPTCTEIPFKFQLEQNSNSLDIGQFGICMRAPEGQAFFFPRIRRRNPGKHPT